MPKVKSFTIKNLLIAMFRDADGDLLCNLNPTAQDSDYKDFGHLICELIRFVACCFEVGEKELFECIERELRSGPTTPITALKRPNR